MDVNDMIDIIKKDFGRHGSYDRYPVRFFGMKYTKDSANEIMMISSAINSFNYSCVEILDIKNLLTQQDGWISINKFRDHLYSLSDNKSYIVVGFSEYARFLSKSEFITLLISLIEIENSNAEIKRRIYIPCFALYSQLIEMTKSYHRRIKDYNPFLNDCIDENLPKIFFLDDSINSGNYDNQIKLSVEWFSMWRNDSINVGKPIICNSPTLSCFYDKACPDNVYNITKITTYEELLKYLYGVEGIVTPFEDSDKYYSCLINKLQDDNLKSFKQIVLNIVNAQEINIQNFFMLWREADTYHRWLILNYILKYDNENTYLRYVLKSLKQLSTQHLFEQTYNYIYQLQDMRLTTERQELLELFSKTETISFSDTMRYCFNQYFCDMLSRHTNMSLHEIDFNNDIQLTNDNNSNVCVKNYILPLVTTCSSYERQLIIWMYRSKLINNEQIKNLYYDLWVYITSFNVLTIENELTHKAQYYLSIYRQCRLSQINGDIYNSELLKWNSSQNSFYKWYTSSKISYPEVILKQQNFTGVTYVLDGVGAEYLEVIANILLESNYAIDSCLYAKSHLPSITSVAKKYYLMNNKWMLEFDKEVIHGQTFYHVCNLEHALSVIRKMINDIVDKEGTKIFSIIADHGSTVGHKLYKRDKKYNFISAEHDGRCCLVENQNVDIENDYIVHEDEQKNKWIISLNQQSLNNSSKYVVHGGATPEEVLIPVLIVHKKENIERYCKVTAKKLNVSGINKTLEFEIVPQPESVQLVAMDGTNIELRYNTIDKVWSGEVNRGIEQEITLYIGNNEFTFKTIPSTKMGDDLFDD